MKSSFDNKIFSATKWSAIAEVTAKITAPITNMILARLLTPNEFGIVAAITIIISFADIFTDAGFQKFVIQHEFYDENILNKYSDVAYTANMLLSLLIYFIIFICRHKLAVLIGCSEAYNGIAVAAMTVLCTSFSSVIIARFRRELNFKPLFFIRLSGALIPLVITVPLAFVLKSYWAIVIGNVFQQFFIATVSVKLSVYKPRIKVDIKLFSEMLSFSLWNLMETLSIWFAGQANVFIVASVLNSYYLGLYKVGMSTINSYMSIITATITPVLFSALSRVQKDKIAYKNTFNKFQKVIAVFVLPMGAGMFLYRDLMVGILLGTQWKEISDFMGLWALMSALTITYSNTSCEVYRSMGKPKISFFLQMIYLVIYVPAIYYAACKGFYTLCWVACVVRGVPVIFDFVMLHKKFEIMITNVIKNTGVQIVATCVMVMVGVLSRKYVKGITDEMLSIFVCGVSYIFIILLFPSMRKELVTMKKRVWN